MYRFLPFLFLAIFSYGTINTNVLLAPEMDAPMLETTTEHDLFSPLPVYQVDSPRQVVQAEGWTGVADFSAAVRACWAKEGLFFRIDITDNDNQFRDTAGDRILLKFHHSSCGPDKTVRSWDLALYPEAAEQFTETEVIGERALKRKVGDPVTQFLTTVDGYSILLFLETTGWDAAPQRSGSMLLQAHFRDVDAEDKKPHEFALFAAGKQGRVEDGRISFTGGRWSSVHTSAIVTGEHSALLLLDAGNLTDSPAKVVITVAGKPGAEALKRLEQEIALPAGKYFQAHPITVDFKGLPAGAYTLSSKISYAPGSDSAKLTYSAGSGIVYAPTLLTRREKRPVRDLQVFKHQMSSRRAFSYMAGAGKVLWSAGTYNASSSDLREKLRLPGERIVQVPGGKSGDVPWALFGGGDTLDGVAEPLVLKFDPNMGSLEKKLQPLPKIVEKNEVPKAREGQLFRRLLLLGVVVTNDGGEPPVLRVSNAQTELLPDTPIQPPQDGKAHSYVFRIWLTDRLDREVRIENSSRRGGLLEIDFLAVVGGDTATGYGLGQPEMKFSGPDEAEHFTRQLYTSLYFMRNYMIDAKGNAFRSLPGGVSEKASPTDYALLLNELASWGSLPEAKKMVGNVPPLMGRRISHQNLELTAAQPLLVLGVYNAWRKNGRPKEMLSRLWSPCVSSPINQIIKVAEAHPVGLVNARGEFGAENPELEGYTRPVASAVSAAINAAIEMAYDSDRGIQATTWRRSLDTFDKNIRRNFAAQDGGTDINSTTIYPAAYGLPSIATITTEIPQDVWLYGWYEDGSPVCYSGDVRVFDTPYLFSGEAFRTYRTGFTINDKRKLQAMQKTFDHMLANSLVFSNASWHHSTVMTYKSTDLHLWTTLAALMLDNREWAKKALHGFIRYTYDEGIIPRVSGERVAECEISPFTFEERLNVSSVGVNLGPSGDDLNIPTAVGAMQVARAMAGIDDHNVRLLRLEPRLPIDNSKDDNDWTKVEVSDWMISHDFEDAKALPINFYSFEKLKDSSYNLVLDCDQRLRQVEVRIGPFSTRIRKVQLASGGEMREVSTVRTADAAWAVTTYDKVKNLDIIARAIRN